MVEVFITNITKERNAAYILDLLERKHPLLSINFDLEDCDHILRVEASEAFIPVADILDEVRKQGFEIMILPDEVPVLNVRTAS